MKKNIIIFIIGLLIVYAGMGLVFMKPSADIVGKLLILVGGYISIFAYINIGKILKLKKYFIGYIINIIGKVISVLFGVIMLFIIITTIM